MTRMRGMGMSKAVVILPVMKNKMTIAVQVSTVVIVARAVAMFWLPEMLMSPSKKKKMNCWTIKWKKKRVSLGNLTSTRPVDRHRINVPRM